jgi:hypothetical protein
VGSEAGTHYLIEIPRSSEAKEAMRNFIAHMNLLWYMYFTRFTHG